MLEYAMFLKQSQNNNHIYEFIMNMPEIKINNAQEYMINKIIAIQRKINALELRSLFLNTYQMIGVNFLSKLKEIIAIGICVFLIIDNQMTLGTLLSISYIVGQLTGPIQSIIGFVKDIQEVGISNERINDVYGTAEEDIHKTEILTVNDIHQISIDHVTFKYPGGYSPFVLEDITLNIPCNKVTAIVGASGSGKTTLLKLLLSYYSPTKGVIRLGKSDMKNIISKEWRNNCGIVLQDGHIFSGTIAENIVFSDDIIDEERLLKSAQIARINDFIESLPMGFHTKIGNIGMQLSGGQKQRILIARAVYKNPQFMFFDEATSALDAENERMIHEQLQSFFKGRTVVIIAHRLSTVKNADNIVVLKKGKIVEQGTHQQLVNNRSDYYHLVKNQLELGA
ncbi:ATP-binding cassette domain-containing protein [Bergeyella zoohelcum]|uniref:peptidase domain-containing ABC transporter n=1 Tax=Bergeyella zoohelcum TaxID=1015 RepID=UPI002A91F967|nr:ATP-binding cassette domain-containing protein [Bergeyella zoohelcum]MDY6025088.1 ATP-binding cassette domain-containing protein [Bergeyella zoohelcum]